MVSQDWDKVAEESEKHDDVPDGDESTVSSVSQDAVDLKEDLLKMISSVKKDMLCSVHGLVNGCNVFSHELRF